MNPMALSTIVFGGVRPPERPGYMTCKNCSRRINSVIARGRKRLCPFCKQDYRKSK